MPVFGDGIEEMKVPVSCAVMVLMKGKYLYPVMILRKWKYL